MSSVEEEDMARSSTMKDTAKLDQLCVGTLRTLSIDAVQKAQSGHPGTPMDAAPAVYCLWQRFLAFDPQDPDWPNRDRFVLSAGHASMLLYSMLHLCGVKATRLTYAQDDRLAVSLNDIKNFRQAGRRHAPDVLLLATGSEVGLCIAAYEQLTSEGIKARVVSMPSWELFEHQRQAYRDSVLPPNIAARVAVEEASTFGWERYTGFGGTIIGLHTFGLSAPVKVVAQHFGFEPAHVVAAAREQVARHGAKP